MAPSCASTVRPQVVTTLAVARPLGRRRRRCRWVCPWPPRHSARKPPCRWTCRGGVRAWRVTQTRRGARAAEVVWRTPPRGGWRPFTFRTEKVASAPRHGCQPCLRESRPRAASRRHYPRVRVALVGDTHSSRAVRPTGACRAPATNAARICAFEATMARPPPCFLTGQGGAYSRSARNRRSSPPPRPEQRRVDGSPFEVSRRASSVSTTRPPAPVLKAAE